MLTTDQKEAILRRAGVTPPAPWAGTHGGQLQQADGERLVKRIPQADSRPLAEEQRIQEINALFDDYTASRAAKSLQNAEVARCAGATMIDRGDPTS